jgi:hypothetical protein
MNYLKEKLTSYPILRFPDLKKQFILTCDSRSYGVGCILAKIGEDGEEHPVSYASRRLTKAEKADHTSEIEMLAIVFVSTHFKYYLFNTKFIVITDHASLQYMPGIKDPSRILRWHLKLAQFDYTIVHRSGKKIGHADALT